MHTINEISRFLLVSIVPQNLSEEETFNDIRELIALVESYGGEVVDIVLQKREIHDKGMYIGKGKVEEVAQLVIDKDVDVVVLNAAVNPAHIYEMQTIFEERKRGINVWDRVDLILKIFSQHANTAEAKLQIELAAMRHMGPRIYGMGEEMSRQGGMVGTRGIGETNTERMKRHWREQMKKVKDDLKRLTKNRQDQMETRAQAGLKTVSLVGYTNAGKSSLFNLLTGKDREVKDALFVTLDSTVGKVFLQDLGKEIIVSDTIGFIRDLPLDLVEAFRSTLMESIYADILLHVIDVSDKDMERKIQTVYEILQDLKLEKKKIIYVFNKIDQAKEVDREEIMKRYSHFQPQFISVKSGEGIEQLKQEISKSLQ